MGLWRKRTGTGTQSRKHGAGVRLKSDAWRRLDEGSRASRGRPLNQWTPRSNFNAKGAARFSVL